MMKRFFILALMVVTSFATFGAVKIRLVYGEKWSEAGRRVKKTLQSSEFKRLAGGKYQLELIDGTDWNTRGNIANSRKLPVLYVIDEKDHCFCMIESVPSGAPAKWLYGQIDKVNKSREKIIKEIGTDTAEGCGKLMFALERFVGGPANITKNGFYADIYEKLKKLDPNDETGWVWHFTFGTELDRGAKRDGLEYVIKANDFRERGKDHPEKIQEGQRFLDSLMKKNKKHLSTEQKQSLLMAEFALHRENPAKKDELITKLEKISDFDENTLWGTAALGWLNLMGKPALSTYWGWKKGDIPVGKFNVTVKFGVDYAFRRPGEYVIELLPDDGMNPVQVDSITLCYKDEEIYKIAKAPFEVKIERAYANKLTSMVIKGNCQRDTSGKFRIHRKVLKPRKAAK